MPLTVFAFFIVVCGLLVSEVASAAPAFVKSVISANNNTGSNTNTYTVTTGTAVAQGDHLIVGCVSGTNADSLSSASDSKSNSYHVDLASLAYSTSDTFAIASAYMTSALTSSDTVTCTWTSAASNRYLAMNAGEYSGLTSTSWTDKTAQATSFRTQANGITSGATATTTQASELVFGYMWVNTGTETLTGTNGYTMRAQQQFSGPALTMGIEDKTVSSTGAQTCTAQWVTGNQSEGAQCVTYKASAGGGARGLFLTPPVSGIGVGGSFFRNPLQWPVAFEGLAFWDSPMLFLATAAVAFVAGVGLAIGLSAGNKLATTAADYIARAKWPTIQVMPTRALPPAPDHTLTMDVRDRVKVHRG